MAFGQASGPPASARRVAELAAVLEVLGYDSFREARHPIGLTQRQAAGKFTTAEVDELLERLEAAAEAAEASEGSEASGGSGAAPPPVRSPRAVAPRSAEAEARAQARRRAADEELVVRLDAEVLATELTNRGWCCIPPE